MKRPPGLWILLSAGFLCLCLDDVHSIRATSLIFGKSTTTTTTTTTTAQPDNAQDEEVATTEQVVDANSTKPTLTGNPQIDYVWDPNLPKELNGYNLSDYPFYERVPEDIDFKCDGLHDGFYASVKHKCQVYHHCLNGIRYDFLCANYTAFDQKTFICHFASEVDCKNSKKFWHRNDALYKAATTTTVKPFVIYTPPPQATVINNPTAIAADVTASFARRPPIGQRPLRRRRPQYEYYDDEYYDDYYEDRLRSTRGRKRPRPRPRPIYYDDYDEEYEDDRYDWRGVRRRNEKRRPYDRKGGRRKNQDRIKDEYREDVSDGSEDEEYRLSSRRKNKDRRKEVEIFEGEDVSDDRPYKRRRPVNSEYKRLRKPFKVKEAEENESDELSRESGKTKERPIIKPISGTIYDKPRIAPKIKLPVPKHEAEKYAYKPLDNEKLKKEEEEAKYYDDYEYEEFVPRSRLPAGQNSKKQRVKISGKERTSEKNEAPKSVKKTDFTEGDDIESYDDYDEAYDEKEGNSMEEDLKNDEPSTLKPVYHHCLFGVRYDFLCANYTAFDQTLFNCNFVSNVDCQNSKKFWHRNDELYKTKSTTTAAPVVYNFRTPPSDIYAFTPSSVAQVPNDQLAGIQPVQPQLQSVLPVIPVGRRPRPAARRPVYDYYDYDDRPIRQRPVQRPRPRPLYDDYDDYEDERYDRRGSRRRRPYNRRPTRKDKDRRRKYEYDYEEYEDEEYDDDFTLGKKRRGDKRRKHDDDYEEDDKGSGYNRRRPVTESGRKKTKRPVDDDTEEYEERKRRPQTDSSSSSRKSSRVGVRRPPSEVYEDDLQEADEERLDKRRKSNNRDNSQSTSLPTDGSRAVIKPVSGTLYDRPRLAPKINLPVPKNAAHKYSYKTVGSTTTPSSLLPKSAGQDEGKEEQIPTETKKVETKPLQEVDTESSGDSSRTLKKTKIDSNSDDAPRGNRRKRPVATTTVSYSKDNNSTEETFPNVQEETPKSRTVMRTFRRPFLPSRGGSPFTARNLKPVGDKISDFETTAEGENTSELHSSVNSDDYEEEEIQERRPDKTNTFRVKSPLSIDITADAKKSRESLANTNTGPGKIKTQIQQNASKDVGNSNKKSEQQVKTTEPSIDELYENYDDTLNEASPVVSFPYEKKFPTGSGSANNNYIYNNRFYRSTQISTN